MSTMSFKSVVVDKDINTLVKEELNKIHDFLINIRTTLDMCDYVDDQLKEVESDLLLVEELTKRIM